MNVGLLSQKILYSSHIMMMMMRDDSVPAWWGEWQSHCDSARDRYWSPDHNKWQAASCALDDVGWTNQDTLGAGSVYSLNIWDKRVIHVLDTIEPHSTRLPHVTHNSIRWTPLELLLEFSILYFWATVDHRSLKLQVRGTAVLLSWSLSLSSLLDRQEPKAQWGRETCPQNLSSRKQQLQECREQARSHDLQPPHSPILGNGGLRSRMNDHGVIWTPMFIAIHHSKDTEST